MLCVLRRPKSNSNVQALQIDAVSDELGSLPTPFSFPHDLNAPDALSPFFPNHIEISIQVVRVVELEGVGTVIESKGFVVDLSACQSECEDRCRRINRKAEILMQLGFAEQLFNIGSNDANATENEFKYVAADLRGVFGGGGRVCRLICACLRLQDV